MQAKEQTIPKGYKHTEVGVIPSDWKVDSFGECADIYRGGSPRPIQDYLTNNPEGINWIKIGDVAIGARYITSTEEKIVPAGAIRSRRVSAGDFLLSNSMSFGRPYILKVDGCIHDGWLAIQNYSNFFTTDYLYYILSSKIVLDQYLQLASGSSVLNLNKLVVSTVKLPIPKKIEQTAIATALSGTDALIEKLTKLIEKKKNIKQGAMQELLTGKRRLPEFGGMWNPISMFDHFSLKARIGWQGLTTAEYLKSGIYHLVTGTDFNDGRINWSTCWFVDKNRYVQDKNIQLLKGDVLLTKDGTIGKVGYVDFLPGPTTLNSGVFVIRPRNNDHSPLFLYYILRSNIFDEFLSKLQAGSTIAHLYQKDFIGFQFAAPSREEQTTIATVLSDMDTEIERLESQLSKYQNLKQGMMQTLLTGKIRLI